MADSFDPDEMIQRFRERAEAVQKRLTDEGQGLYGLPPGG